MVLFEKGQKTLEGLFITPIRMAEYILSKIISLTILALLSGFLITVATFGISFNFAWLFLGISLTSVLFVLLGFTLVSITKSVNAYLVFSPVYMIVTMIPLLDYFQVVKSPLFYLIPTQASLTLMAGAFAPSPIGEMVLSTVLLLGFICPAYLWAAKWFYKYIVLRTGAAS
jgi:fluoroquinolone transport system permease protein